MEITTTPEETGIHDIQLQIQGGNRYLMGPNGAGKSTLLKFWLDLPSLLVSTTSRTGPLTKTSWKIPIVLGKLFQQVGLIFQNSDTQLFNTSVYDELAFGPRQLGLAETEVQQRVKGYARSFRDWTPERSHSYHLSGGEKKLVAIASVPHHES